ncbi:MAG: 4a-hydroxytetrahydrobiopterin dehydratase [Balneolales bacterium]
MTNLAEQQCIPCRGDTPVLKGEKLQVLYNQLDGHWELEQEHHLTRDLEFNDFKEALDFTIRVGEMSEEQGHHPEIYLAWGKVTLKVYTHAIDGLSESDFIWAAKAENIFRENFE